jgi:uncharacterized protein YfiM (DUF2279 family)
MNPGALVLCLCFSLGAGPGPAPRDPWFAEDKLMHFAASFAATTLAASAARSAGLSRGGSTIAGAIAAGGVWLWKEIDDQRQPDGFFSTRDLVWDAAGIAAAAAVLQRTR